MTSNFTWFVANFWLFKFRTVVEQQSLKSSYCTYLKHNTIYDYDIEDAAYEASTERSAAFDKRNLLLLILLLPALLKQVQSTIYI